MASWFLGSPQSPADSSSNPPPPRQPSLLRRLAGWVTPKLVTQYTSRYMAGAYQSSGYETALVPMVGMPLVRVLLSTVSMRRLKAYLIQRLTEMTQGLATGSVLGITVTFVARQGLN
eukprot:RCo027081